MFNYLKYSHSLSLVMVLGFIITTGCTPATQDPHKISTETANLLTSSLDFNGAKTEILPVSQKPAENAGDPSYPQVTQLSAPGSITGQSFELNIYTDYQNAADVVGAVMYIPPATEFMTVEGSLLPVTSSAEAMRFAALQGISQTQTLYFMHFIITLNWDKSFGGKIPKIEFALQKSDGTVGNYWVWEPEIAPDPGDGGPPVDAGSDGSEPIDSGTDAGTDGGSGCTEGAKRCDNTSLMICTGNSWVLEKDCALEYPARNCVETGQGQAECQHVNPFFTKVKSNDYRFDGRSGHTSAVFNSLAWVFGGSYGNPNFFFNDSWSTADGIGWRNNYSDYSSYPDRTGHTTVVFKGKVFIIGGTDYLGTIYLNDVWSSPDGTDWTQESLGASSPFAPRAFHSSAVFTDPSDGKEKIWVIGGSCLSIPGCDDVWASEDGKEWVQKVAKGDSRFQRNSHTSVVYDGKIWVIGGYQTGGTFLNDYFSTDGINWTSPVQGPFPARENLSSLVVGTKFYIVGGLAATGNLNDVWSYGTEGWTMVRDETTPNGFTTRQGHTTVNFGPGFLLMGGYNGNNYMNDVWSSADGVSWTQIRPNGYPVLAPRYFHTGVTLDGYLTVIGGEPDYNSAYRDLWLSSNGLDWSQQSSIPVDGLTKHSSVVFKPAGETAERVYAIGGQIQIQSSRMITNIAWSYDNINGWRTDYDAGSPNFSPRYNHSSTVFKDPADQKDKIWVIGGNLGGQIYPNDVWASENGWYWNEFSDGGINAIQPPREMHCSVAFDGGIWVIGGSENVPPINTNYYNDVWYSANGRDWQKTADSTNRFPPRAAHACALHDNKMWVSGGMEVVVDGGSSYMTTYNDLWYSSDGTNWSEYCGPSTCEYPGRYGHSMSDADGYLWIFGGMGKGSAMMNDVWKSDGK